MGSPTWLSYQTESRQLGLASIDTCLGCLPEPSEGVSRWGYSLPPDLIIVHIFSPQLRPWAQK